LYAHEKKLLPNRSILVIWVYKLSTINSKFGLAKQSLGVVLTQIRNWTHHQPEVSVLPWLWH